MSNSVQFAMTPAQYGAACALAAKNGIELAALAPSAQTVSGIAESHGCRIGYEYTVASQILTLTVLSKPWLFPMSEVLSRLKDAVNVFEQQQGRG